MHTSLTDKPQNGQPTEQNNDRQKVMQKYPDHAVDKRGLELGLRNTHTRVNTRAIGGRDTVHCSADTGEHCRGEHGVSACGGENGNDDAAEDLDLRGAGQKHAEHSGKEGNEEAEQDIRKLQVCKCLSDSFLNVQIRQYVAHEISKQHERCGGHDLEHALADVVINTCGRHLSDRLFAREKDTADNDERGDKKQEAATEGGRAVLSKTRGEEAVELTCQKEGEKDDDGKEDRLPTVFERLTQTGNILFSHRFNLVVAAHAVQSDDALQNEPQCHAPQKEPVLRERIGVGVKRIERGKRYGNHARGRDHVAHRAGMRLYVCGKVGRKARVDHSGNGEHTRGCHVTGAGAGKRTHVGASDNGNEARAAAEAAEDGENDGDTVVNDRRFGKQCGGHDEYEDNVKRRFAQCVPDVVADVPPRVRQCYEDDEGIKHALVKRALEEGKADDCYRKHGD